jgi:hypothetical protein
MGITDAQGQWAIVGGTGELARADGTIKHKIVPPTPTTSINENYRQLDIHAFYSPPAVNRILKNKSMLLISPFGLHIHENSQLLSLKH